MATSNSSNQTPDDPNLNPPVVNRRINVCIDTTFQPPAREYKKGVLDVLHRYASEKGDINTLMALNREYGYNLPQDDIQPYIDWHNCQKCKREPFVLVALACGHRLCQQCVPNATLIDRCPACNHPMSDLLPIEGVHSTLDIGCHIEADVLRDRALCGLCSTQFKHIVCKRCWCLVACHKCVRANLRLRALHCPHCHRDMTNNWLATRYFSLP